MEGQHRHGEREQDNHQQADHALAGLQGALGIRSVLDSDTPRDRRLPAVFLGNLHIVLLCRSRLAAFRGELAERRRSPGPAGWRHVGLVVAAGGELIVGRNPRPAPVLVMVEAERRSRGARLACRWRGEFRRLQQSLLAAVSRVALNDTVRT